MKVFTRKRNAAQAAKPESALRVALSYGIFLLLCLALGIGLYLSVIKSARDDCWNHQSALLSNNVITMDHYLATVDSYTRQLTNDSTFIRFSNMKNLRETGYITAADTIMQTLASRAFSLANVPITESHIYLKNTKYVISSSQFTEVRQFYMDYNIWKKDQYQNWLNMLSAAGGSERNFDTSAFSGIPGSYTLVRDIDDIFVKTIPAIIWFDWDMAALTKQFLGHIAYDGAMLVAVSPENKPQLLLYGKGATAESMAALVRFALAMHTEEQLSAYRVLRQVSARNSWRYYLAVPQALCTQTLGGSDLIFFLLFTLVLTGGILIIVLRVRHTLLPIRHLGSRLQAEEDYRQQLEMELSSQKPYLYSSYLRRMLSGHVASESEFQYMMRFFGIDGEGLRYLVLYCCGYTQNERDTDSPEVARIMTEKITAALQTAYRAYTYTTLDQSVVTLVTYGADAEDPLMDLQSRVIRLHDELLGQYDIWFFAGVGTVCTHAFALWESYEQARTASRYASKNHVFLPYDVIGKKTAGVYYPIEISVKLLHFITTGNTPQVQEMFQLIHRENFTERSLPVNMLNYLLSDIRNTLMKARFSLPPEAEADGKELEQLDKALAQQATLPLCESIAVSLCGFFSGTMKPADPIPEIRDYLKQNYGDPSICLSMLSNQFHISESYLSHLFKEKTGENFSVHLEKLRLNEAAKRLKKPEQNGKGKELSINALYMEVGYNSAVTFRRAFKKHFGMTPSEMRDSLKGK